MGYNELPSIGKFFYGLGAAVSAIIVVGIVSLIIRAAWCKFVECVSAESRRLNRENEAIRKQAEQVFRSLPKEKQEELWKSWNLREKVRIFSK